MNQQALDLLLTFADILKRVGLQRPQRVQTQTEVEILYVMPRDFDIQQFLKQARSLRPPKEAFQPDERGGDFVLQTDHFFDFAEAGYPLRTNDYQVRLRTMEGPLADGPAGEVKIAYPGAADNPNEREAAELKLMTAQEVAYWREFFVNRLGLQEEREYRKRRYCLRRPVILENGPGAVYIARCELEIDFFEKAVARVGRNPSSRPLAGRWFVATSVELSDLQFKAAAEREMARVATQLNLGSPCPGNYEDLFYGRVALPDD
jgi:hypothetical protein